MRVVRNTLSNGARYLLLPQENDTKTFTILVLFKSGSRNETKGLYGAAHFIEHLFFKGTKKRPNTQAISKELDSIGAEYNAFTAKDHTGIYIKTSSFHFEMACELLSDLIWNSQFDAREMEKEKRVIIEEVKMYEENPLMRIDDLFETIVYKGNPLSRIISGQQQDVLQYRRYNVLNFKQHYYGPKSILVTLAGNIPSNSEVLLRKYFLENAPSLWKKPLLIQRFSSFQKSPRIVVEQKELSQVQVALGFPALSLTHPKIYAAKLLSLILGGSMSSRLFTSVREKHGLAYSINTYLKTFEDTGHLVVYGGIDEKRIDAALRLILSELKKIRTHMVNTKELDLSKEFLKGKTLLALEDSSFTASFYAKQELFKNSFFPIEELFKKFNAVTKEDILDVAKKIITPKKINLALIGPFQNTERFLNLEKLL